MSKVAPSALILLALTGVLLGLGFATEWAWYLSALIGAGIAIRMVWQAIREGEVGSDILALISIIATGLTSEWLASAIIALMLTTGQALESWAAGRARNQLEALVQRAPRTVHLVQPDGSLIERPLADAKIGDRFLVRTGEVVALDGMPEAQASFDESALTGEPIPQEHSVGQQVASGVVNISAPVILKATTDAHSSTYSALVRLVEQAKAHSAPGVRIANRWALWFVPLSLALAGATWFFTQDVKPAIAVLVAATPCPLILAVPIAIIAGISNAAKNGAIIKDGAALEQLANAKALLVDKTGTLTHGGPAVTETQVAPGIDEDIVLQWAASLEQASAHVLAKAVVAEAERRELPLLPAMDVTEILGEGLEGIVASRKLLVGRVPRDLPDWVQVKAALQIAVFVDGSLAAILDLDDPIRPDAAATVKRLRSLGLRQIVLVTGDRKPAAEAIGNAVGVDQIFSECRPEDKLKILNQVRQESGLKILVVGDGINDAPALAAADAGVAMGARGATAASESASVVIVEDSITRLADAIEIAKGATARALQAAGIGMTLSILAMLSGAFGLVSPTENAIAQEAIDAAAILWALVPPRRRAVNR